LLHVTATHTFYILSLHDALPIYDLRADRHPHLRRLALRVALCGGVGGRAGARRRVHAGILRVVPARVLAAGAGGIPGGYRLLARSEEHTSELQSRENLVCRLLIE